MGILFRQDLGWSRVRPECREHLWLAGSLMGQRTAVGVVYMWCGQTDSKTRSCGGAYERISGAFKPNTRCCYWVTSMATSKT